MAGPHQPFIQTVTTKVQLSQSSVLEIIFLEDTQVSHGPVSIFLEDTQVCHGVSDMIKLTSSYHGPPRVKL